MKKNLTFLNGLINTSLCTVALAIFIGPSALAASPSDEIRGAVRVAGGVDIRRAAPATFLQGFRAVIIKAKPSEAPLYVSTAVRMRSELAPQITVAALNARPLNRCSCEGIDAIIKAAITAAPNLRQAIARAALTAQPAARDCVLAATGTTDADLKLAYTTQSDSKDVADSKDVGDGKHVAESKQAVSEPCSFAPPTIWDVGNIVSINPGPGGIFVVSPSDPDDQ